MDKGHTLSPTVIRSSAPAGSILLGSYSGQESSPSVVMNTEMDAVEAEHQIEMEEKTRLINQVLELQHTLEDLSARVDAVKEENLKLKSENQISKAAVRYVQRDNGPEASHANLSFVVTF
ncbi:hypothetical protein NDU88_005287 [Pleurodeles waltl]|uniref:Short coiled-coil protein n=1 Tax=Pleurodeles waltl TaxID=8319 RepID=A0AAV7WY86_PLEWA|nr:hypothetical protein NDU88_005287 [Pleurodeles waltl]